MTQIRKRWTTRWRVVGVAVLGSSMGGMGAGPADGGGAASPPAAPIPILVQPFDSSPVRPPSVLAPPQGPLTPGQFVPASLGNGAGSQAPPPPVPTPPAPAPLIPPPGGSAPGTKRSQGPTETLPVPRTVGAPAPATSPASLVPAAGPKLPIDLPYALRLVNASNPTIAVAQARVREAYARQQQAFVAWLPNLWAGSNPDNLTFMPTYYVHSGQLQTSRGDVVSVAKASVAFPLGVGMNLSFADALFGPRIARNLTAAEAARARGIVFNVQLDVALTYLDLLRVYGALAINAEATGMAETMYRYAELAVRVGLSKTTADANRARTELEIRRQERYDLEGQGAAISAHLAQLLLLEPTADLVPADAQILPIELVPLNGSLDELVAVGLLNRPELAESRALVAAALARWREDRTRPLLPNLQMAFYGAQFGAGVPGLHNYGGRDDFFVQANWELRNGGLGNWFQARESRARFSAANFHVAEVQAQVGAEVTAAAKIARSRQQALNNAQEAVSQAEETWRRLARAGFGMAVTREKRPQLFDALEPLLAEQALHAARLQYLTEVIEYNREQFRLFWALGQPPLEALPKACALPVGVSVTPPPYREPEPLPRQPRLPGLPP